MSFNLSPSAAHRWLKCPGSLLLEQGKTEEKNQAAIAGSFAHLVAEKSLKSGFDVDFIEGFKFEASEKGNSSVFAVSENGEHVVDKEIVSNVQSYINAIKSFAGDNVILVEQEIKLHKFFGEFSDKSSKGTADAIVYDAKNNILQVHDLKYGMCKVYAENNPQIGIYALGYIEEHKISKKDLIVKLFIHQPRLDHLDIFETTYQELHESLGRDLRRACGDLEFITSESVNKYLNPSESACKWCKAKAQCPALAQKALEHIAGDFALESKLEVSEQIRNASSRVSEITVDHLALIAEAIPLIEMFTNAVQCRIRELLNDGVFVPGWKLVMGREGNRQWRSEHEVIDILKDLDADLLYKKSLLSVPDAEKLLKSKVIAKEVFEELGHVIVRSPARPMVALSSDKRLEVIVNNDGFEFN